MEYPQSSGSLSWPCVSRPVIEMKIETLLEEAAPDFGALERNHSSQLGLQSCGQSQNFRLGGFGYGRACGSRAFSFCKVGEVRQPHYVLPASLSVAGAPLPLFIPLQDVCPATWPFLPGRLLRPGL